jgi:hypothetical protein
VVVDGIGRFIGYYRFPGIATGDQRDLLFHMIKAMTVCALYQINSGAIIGLVLQIRKVFLIRKVKAVSPSPFYTGHITCFLKQSPAL